MHPRIEKAVWVARERVEDAASVEELLADVVTRGIRLVVVADASEHMLAKLVRDGRVVGVGVQRWGDPDALDLRGWEWIVEPADAAVVRRQMEAAATEGCPGVVLVGYDPARLDLLDAFAKGGPADPPDRSRSQ